MVAVQIDAVGEPVADAAGRQVPRPEELAAALRLLHGRYDVVLRAASGAGIELFAEQPPKDLSALRELAGWFALFCPSVLHQPDGVGKAASRLLMQLSSPVWTCRWFVD